MPSKKIIFFLCIYKMVQISKKGYEKYGVEVIDKWRYFWVNIKDLEVESDVANCSQIFHKCDPEKQKYKNELMSNQQFQPCRRFVRNQLVGRKIKTAEKHQKNL